MYVRYLHTHIHLYVCVRIDIYLFLMNANFELFAVSLCDIVNICTVDM